MVCALVQVIDNTKNRCELWKVFTCLLFCEASPIAKIHHQSVCWPGPGTRQGSFITIKRNPRHALQRQSPCAVHSCILAWMWSTMLIVTNYNWGKPEWALHWHKAHMHLVCGPITSPVCVLTRASHGARKLTSGCLMTFIFVISYYPRLFVTWK